MCRLSPSCFEEQNKGESPELWVQQLHASSWLKAQFFNQLRWAELFGIDDYRYVQRSFSWDVYEALTSRAIPEKQNGQVIPDSEDERALSPWVDCGGLSGAGLHKANQNEAPLLWGVSACYTSKNCNKKLLGCSLGTACSIDVVFNLAIVLHFMIISLHRSSAQNHHFTEEQTLGFN